MAVTGRTVIGVFDEAGNANNAIDALQNAGFSSSEIYHSEHNRASTESRSIWPELVSFFTGANSETGGQVANDLTGMGVSDDEAQYYENEYKNGHTILAVNAGSRADDAKAVLDSNGAYNYTSRGGGPTAATTHRTTTGMPDTGYADAATMGYSAGTTDTTDTSETTDVDPNVSRN